MFIQSFLLIASAFLFGGCGESAVGVIGNTKTENPPLVQNDPPECEACLFLEAPANLTEKLIIAPDRRGVERLRLRGTIYESDGRTPAKNTVLYIYHTDEKGYYSKRGDEPRDSFAWWHGKQRGWLRTNERGEYEIDTVKPAPYPSRVEPAHIHAHVKSPSQKHSYIIADFVFAGDDLLTAKYWENSARWRRSIGITENLNDGGVKLTRNPAGVWEGVRNIALFPEYDLPKPNSGRDILAESPAFGPQHAWGPDKGSHACPMCKYGYQPGVLYWVNDERDWAEIENWTGWLENLSDELGAKNFKAYLIYTNPNKQNAAEMETKLAALGEKLNIKHIALTYVPAADDRKSSVYLNQINSQTRNTVIVYNNRHVADKFVNLAFTEQNQNLLKAAVERAGKEKQLYKLEK